MGIFDRLKRNSSSKVSIQGLRITDASMDDILNTRYGVDINGGDATEINTPLGPQTVFQKASLPVWYTQHPYGHPRTDDMETLRNIAQMGIVQRCIRLYIQKIKSTPWSINPVDPTADDSGTKERIKNITKWFKSASTNETSFFQELERTLWDFFELGEGVLVKMFLATNYVEIPPHNQRVVLSDDKTAKMIFCQSYDVSQFQVFATDHNNILGHWQFNYVKNGPKFFAPRELIVFQDQPSNARLYGRPRIASILAFLETIAHQTLQIRNFYKKGGVLQGVVTTAGASDLEQKKIEKFFTEKFRSMEHKLALLQGGKDFDVEFLPLMLNVKDLAFLEGFDFIQRFVMSVFDIMPEELLGNESSKAGASESSRKQRARIRAMLNDIEFAVNKEILRELNPEEDLIFEYEKDTDPEVLRIIQEKDGSQLDRGQITLNEWRKSTGREPYQDERANVPAPFLEMDNAEKNALAMKEAIGQPGKDPKEMEGKDDSDIDPPTDTEDDNAEEPGKEPKKPLDNPKDKKKVLESNDILKAIDEKALDAKLDKILGRLSRSMQKDLVEIFKRWEAEAKALNIMNGASITEIKDLVDKIIIQEQLTTGITESMMEAFRVGLNIDNAFEVGTTFSVPDRRTLEYFRTYPLIVSERVTTRVSNALTVALDEGVTLGESRVKLSARINEIMLDLKTYEADRIARTETTNAMTWGQINAMRETGAEEWEFYTSLDDRVCPICGPLHGKRFSIDDVEFKPPVHPNCRCTLLNVIEEEEDIIRGMSWFPSAKMGEIELRAGETITKMLKDRLNDKLSTRDIAKEFKTTHQTVNSWINKFKLRD